MKECGCGHLEEDHRSFDLDDPSNIGSCTLCGCECFDEEE